MIYLELFFEFLKIGIFAVGGGMATLPFLYDLSDRTAWFSYTQIADMLAVSESTPGPIGINMATYVGFTVAGIPGSIIATLGVILPGVIIVLILCKVLDRFSCNRRVESAFYGLRPASIGLISAAGITVISISLLNIDAFRASGNIQDIFAWKAIIMALCIWALTHFFKFAKKIHPVLLIAASAVIGIVFSFAGV